MVMRYCFYTCHVIMLLVCECVIYICLGGFYCHGQGTSLLKRDGALGKGGAYCVHWFQSKVLHRGGKKLSTGS